MLGLDGSETRPHTTHGDARARTLAPTSLCSPPRYNCRTMADWARRLGLSREALINSARTAVATVASLLLARSLKLPEFYWAPISTIVILLSTINPLTLAWQRFGGTALGAALGALIATFFSSNWIVYGAGIFVCGIVCSFLRVGSAYRFAAITLSIVLLVAHERALDRRVSPVRGSIAGNRRGAAGRGGVAGQWGGRGVGLGARHLLSVGQSRLRGPR